MKLCCIICPYSEICECGGIGYDFWVCSHSKAVENPNINRSLCEQLSNDFMPDWCPIVAEEEKEAFSFDYFYCAICGKKIENENSQGLKNFIHHVNCNPNKISPIPVWYDTETGNILGI